MDQQRVRVFEGGKLVIPAPMRRSLGIAVGDTVMLSVDDGEIRIRSLDASIARARAILRRHVPEGVSLVDELIKDRRTEAAADAGSEDE